MSKCFLLKFLSSMLSFRRNMLYPCHAELIKMPHLHLIFSQSDYLIKIVDINSHTEWQTVQIQISWLLKKPTDLGLHCLQRQGTSWFSRTWVKFSSRIALLFHIKPTSISVKPVYCYFWDSNAGIDIKLVKENYLKVEIIFAFLHQNICWCND